MEQVYPKKLFSMTCKLRGKNDFWWLIYILYGSANDVFQSIFVFAFTNKTNFPLWQVVFLYDLYIEREKMMYIWPLMTFIYFIWAEFKFSLSISVLLFSSGTTFP